VCAMAQGRGRTRTWDVARPRGAAWPGAELGGVREVIARWFATDTAAGRLMPWLPIAFGLGVVLYFTAEREPVWWVTLAVAAACAVAAVLARKRPVGFPLLIGIAAVAIGFA